MTEYTKDCGCHEDEWCDICHPPRRCRDCIKKDSEIADFEEIVRGQDSRITQLCRDVERLISERDEALAALRCKTCGGTGVVREAAADTEVPCRDCAAARLKDIAVI